MKTNFLFPNRFKKIGWMILIPTIVLGILWMIFDLEPEFLNVKFQKGSDFIFSTSNNNVLDEIIGVLLIVSSLMVGFSREKVEDEFIAKIRLESLAWATYVNYGILLVSILFVYGLEFFNVMIFNMFTILIFFIIRFHWVLYKSKKAIKYEESYQG